MRLSKALRTNRRPVLRGFAGCFGALLLCQCQSLNPAKLSDYATKVPMPVEGNLPFVEVEIGGQTAEFLVDTGASDCVISPQMAQAMGLYVSKEKALVKSAAGDRVPIPMTIIPRLKIGNAEFHTVPAFVYDFSEIRGHITRMQGVIGYSIFRQSTLTLDYPARKLTITPGPTLDPRDPAVMTLKSTTGVPRIPLSGGPKTVYIDVDSGSTGGLEVNPYALGVRTAAPPRPGGLSTSIGNTYRTGMARVLGSLYLGHVEMAHPIVEVTTGDYRVGGEVLQNTVLSLDQPSRLARLAFSKGFPFFAKKQKLISPSRVGTGLGFDHGWIVRDVVPDSPAQRAGIRVGDFCRAINGQPTRNLQDDYGSLLQSQSRIHYEFVRQGRPYQVVLPVVTQVH